MRAAYVFLALPLFFCGAACAAMPALQVQVDGVKSGEPIPAAQAVCLPTTDGKSDASGKNIRPTISWSGAPKGTESFAIFIMDPDVPADFSDAGKAGKVIAKDAKRQDFYHYGLVNLPATSTRVIDNTGNIDKNLGYPLYINPSDPAHGTIELLNDMGLNNYVKPATAYGGPCPPWNDARVHHYHYIVLALDKDAPANIPCPNNSADPAAFCNTAKNTFTRLITSKHVLAKGVVIGTYTLNQTLYKQPEKR